MTATHGDSAISDPVPPIEVSFGTRLALALDGPPNAAAFIVTIYGDVVDPRGGVLWMG